MVFPLLAPFVLKIGTKNKLTNLVNNKLSRFYD